MNAENSTTLRKSRYAGLALFLSLLIVAPVWGAEPSVKKFAAGELLVKEKFLADQDLAAKALQSAGATVVSQIAPLGVKRLKVPAHDLEQLLAELQRNPRIEFVEPNYLAQGTAVPNDSGYAEQWHLPKISAPLGWEISTGSTAEPIAFIDSGVDTTHPDLAPKLLPGWNFVTGSGDVHDLLDHGTTTAGTAAAIANNGEGVSGLAWENPIMPLVVLDQNNEATYADIAQALVWAVDHGARVINISIAGNTSSTTLQSAVDYAWGRGAVVIAAASNEKTSTPWYPAACRNVVAVAATDKRDTSASFSNFGPWVDVAAPGYAIYTTSLGGYRTVSGTSQSAPLAAGLAALIWSVNPTLTNAEVVGILLNSADDLGEPGFDVIFGHGRINAEQALRTAQTYAREADVAAPAVAIVSPVEGEILSRVVTVSVSASDDRVVERVELYVDGALLGSLVEAPFAFAWDVRTAAAGLHALEARAYDGAGNVGVSQPVGVQVIDGADGSAPLVTISQPLPGASMEKYQFVTAQAVDEDAVVRMELYVDGALRIVTGSGSLTTTLAVNKMRNGAHTLTVKAFDALGNEGIDTITVYK